MTVEIDPSKYAGLNREESERMITEDKRRAINQDLRTKAFIPDMDCR